MSSNQQTQQPEDELLSSPPSKEKQQKEDSHVPCSATITTCSSNSNETPRMVVVVGTAEQAPPSLQSPPNMKTATTPATTTTLATRTPSPRQRGWAAMSPLSFDGVELSFQRNKRSVPRSPRGAPYHLRSTIGRLIGQQRCQTPQSCTSSSAASSSLSYYSVVSAAVSTFKARPVPRSTFHYQAPLAVRSSLVNQLGFLPGSIRRRPKSLLPASPSRSTKARPEDEYWNKLYHSTPPFRAYPKRPKPQQPQLVTLPPPSWKKTSPNRTPPQKKMVEQEAATLIQEASHFVTPDVMVEQPQQQQQQEDTKEQESWNGMVPEDDAVVLSPRVLFEQQPIQEEENEEQEADDETRQPPAPIQEQESAMDVVKEQDSVMDGVKNDFQVATGETAEEESTTAESAGPVPQQEQVEPQEGEMSLVLHPNVEEEHPQEQKPTAITTTAAFVPYVPNKAENILSQQEDDLEPATSEQEPQETQQETNNTAGAFVPYVFPNSNENGENTLVPTDGEELPEQEEEAEAAFASHVVNNSNDIVEDAEEAETEASMPITEDDIVEDAEEVETEASMSITEEEEERAVADSASFADEGMTEDFLDEGITEDSVPTKGQHLEEEQVEELEATEASSNDNAENYAERACYSAFEESEPLMRTLLHGSFTQNHKEPNNEKVARQEEEEEPSFWYRAAAGVADSSGQVRVHLSLFGGRQQQDSSSDDSDDEEHDYRNYMTTHADSGEDDNNSDDAAADDNSSSAEEIIFVPQTTRDLVAQHILQRHHVDKPLNITVGFLPRIDSVGSSAASGSFMASIIEEDEEEEEDELQLQDSEDYDDNGQDEQDEGEEPQEGEIFIHPDQEGKMTVSVPWYTMRLSARRLGKNVVLAVALPYLLGLATTELKQQQQQQQKASATIRATATTGFVEEQCSHAAHHLPPPQPLHQPNLSKVPLSVGTNFFHRRRHVADEWDERAAVRELVDSTARVLERGDAILQQIRVTQEAVLDVIMQEPETFAVVVHSSNSSQKHHLPETRSVKKLPWRKIMTQALVNLGGSWYMGQVFSPETLVPLGGIGQLPAWYGLVQSLQPIILVYAGLFNVVFPLVRYWATLRQQPQQEMTEDDNYDDVANKPFETRGATGKPSKASQQRAAMPWTTDNADSAWRPRAVLSHNKKRRRMSARF